MVKGNTALNFEKTSEQESYNLIPDELKHVSVSLKEVFQNLTRLEASAFSLDAKIEKERILQSPFEPVPIWSEKGLVKDCYYGGRAKRDYVSKEVEGAIGFLGSAEMLEVKPKPVKFLSSKRIDVSPFAVKKGTILISRSGTIGNVTFVGETLSQHLVSEHAIRLIPREYGGYLYAYLKTDTGRTLVKANTFGAVVDQIEPAHFKKVLVPNPPRTVKKEIHDLIVESYELRDRSNELLNKAEKLLYEELCLPGIEKIEPKYLNSKAEVRNYTTRLSNLQFRLDSSFHVPHTKEILNVLAKNSLKIKKLGDPAVSKEIILPGRFKRVYVNKENGTPFLGGKQLLELDPYNVKYLSTDHHGERIKEQLLLKEDMIAVTCSGTIGKVNIIPKHWENWTLNQHVMRIVPYSKDIAGYIYCWLNTDYGYKLITRHIYGSVVDEIDNRHLSEVEIPFLKDQAKQKEINDLVMKANKLRYQAHEKEQNALDKMKDILKQKKGENLSISAI